MAMTVRGLPDFGRCAVLGVLNVTPDSFSDGGLAWPDEETAIARGLALAADGADIVDVGGESTRPGAIRVPAHEEWRRIGGVITALAHNGVTVSVDTMRAETAERALAAGARIVNDVSGGLADPAMGAFVAGAGCPYVAMHWRAHSTTMNRHADYADVVADVAAELRQRVAALADAGVAEEQIIVDPGIGFAKNAAHNWALLHHLDALAALGRPVLVGASRKRFLGALLAAGDGEPRPAADRDAATTAITALVAEAGAWGVRVHDVGGSADAVRVAAAVRAAR